MTVLQILEPDTVTLALILWRENISKFTNIIKSNIFTDFWERFQDSLRTLSEKRQQTVCRSTLVKAWNTEELENYAQLIRPEKPDSILIKGVTYYGTSKTSTLSMENVLWRHEVITFGQFQIFRWRMLAYLDWLWKILSTHSQLLQHQRRCHRSAARLHGTNTAMTCVGQPRARLWPAGKLLASQIAKEGHQWLLNLVTLSYNLT